MYSAYFALDANCFNLVELLKTYDVLFKKQDIHPPLAPRFHKRGLDLIK